MLGGAAILLWSSVLSAAEQAARDTTEEDEELAEVQVTGTRIQSPNVTSANPITSITAEEMRRLGIVNVADALTQLVPANISTYMPTLTGDDQAGRGAAGLEGLDRGSFFIGNTIANLRGLDPTFGSRTLTLIDGRRVPSTSNQADVVDLNIIPSNLLERVDVVTGGASATYGSGAMAGVVNLVLARRKTGVNLDMDYGVTGQGDGNSPHVSLSGGLPLFGGKAHLLLGAEWQDTKAIRNCAAARDWCAESRSLLNNSSQLGQNPAAPFTPLLEYSDGTYPARFEVANMRRSQFAPTGTLFFNNVNVTSNIRFNDAGTAFEEYALGFRGGTGGSGGGSAMNGDSYADGTFSPQTTWNTVMQPASERKSFFSNFEYDFTSTTTGYLQTSYARTDARNENGYTQNNYCVRFDSPGTALQIGATASSGDRINGFPLSTPQIAVDFDSWLATGATSPVLVWPAIGAPLNNANFRLFLGWSGGTMPAPGFAAPYWIAGGVNGTTYPAASGASRTNAPTYTFANGIPHWIHVKNNPPSGQEWWVMDYITITADFADPGTQAELPGMGRNAYAFLNNLSPEALGQVQRAFSAGGNYGDIIDPKTGALLTGASTVAAGGAGNAGLDTLYGPAPCQGSTEIRKVWNPQLKQYTTQVQEPWRAVLGLRGRFGSDWRWDSYVQYGKTDSKSVSHNVATNLRLAMSLDAVIDDRPDSATYGQPVCRAVRDGLPVIDYQGRPLSQLEDLQRLADNCKPLNLFGTTYASSASMPGYADRPYDAAALQQQAISYAFVDSRSSGWNDLAVLSLTTNGTLWQGWAGPLSGAFGVELTQNRVNNSATSNNASIYERADLSSVWSDGFGGKTRTTEGYAEFNMPIVTGQDGLDLWSLNVGGRYTSYYNKGGEGTTGQHATQDVFNWKFQTEFAPFDWVRFRLTRSLDQRTAGYRDLFINSNGQPDQFAGANPWREWNQYSNEGRQERWAQVRTGNPDLKPEKSTTLTLGLVLQPGGWAQGMTFSVDYYNIRVKDGIATPFNASTTSVIQSCWQNSGNQDGSATDPDIQPINGQIDYDFYDAALQRYPCREIAFARNDDDSINLLDIISYNSARPINVLPYQRRGMDLAWSYNFPLNRAFDSLPGSVALNLRATRAMESSGIQLSSGGQLGGATFTEVTCNQVGGRWEGANANCYIPLDLVGQIRSSQFVPGVSASPKWVGNVSGSYLLGDLTMTLSARYIGGAKMDNRWCDSEGCPYYKDASGAFLTGSVDNNFVKPYANFALNGSYNLHVGSLKQFQVFGSINNLFDKTPPFSGGGISGASSQYHDILGRAYRMGVRMSF